MAKHEDCAAHARYGTEAANQKTGGYNEDNKDRMLTDNIIFQNSLYNERRYQGG